MKPRVRTVALFAHVTVSVAWVGAVVAYLALAVTAVTTGKTELLRAAHLAMDVLAWWVLVPLSLASLVTGLVQSFGTSWGLFRHYWVLLKAVLTVPATVVLLAYAQSTDRLAAVASDPSLSPAELALLQHPTHVVHSSGGLLVLLVITALAVAKPRGMTSYGWSRKGTAPSG